MAPRRTRDHVTWGFHVWGDPRLGSGAPLSLSGEPERGGGVLPGQPGALGSSGSLGGEGALGGATMSAVDSRGRPIRSAAATSQSRVMAPTMAGRTSYDYVGRDRAKAMDAARASGRKQYAATMGAALAPGAGTSGGGGSSGMDVNMARTLSSFNKKGSSADDQPDALAPAKASLSELMEKVRGDSKNFGSRAWGAGRMVSNNMREAARESGVNPNSLAGLQMKGNALARSAGEISRAHAGLIDASRGREMQGAGLEGQLAAQSESIKIARAQDQRDAAMSAFQKYLAMEQLQLAKHKDPVWRRLQRGGSI